MKNNTTIKNIKKIEKLIKKLNLAWNNLFLKQNYEY